MSYLHNIILIISLYIFTLFAADPAVDESALFSDTTTLVAPSSLADTQRVKDPSEKKGTSVGGDIIAASLLSANSDFLTHYRLANTSMMNLLVGSVELDSRLPNETKVFGNLEVDYMPALDSLDRYALSLRELFLDVNANRRAYFRVGKQVLQWGRCYFWNPTDLINVERRPFIEKIGFREGVLGAKAHVPFGTVANLYGFLDLHSATRPDSLALSLKGEYLFGGTEMALSAWGKRGKPVVLGYDISTHVLGLDVAGEMSISNGDVKPRIAMHDSLLWIDTVKNGVTPRVSLGISRFFDFMDFHDALQVEVEGFYNGGGYTENLFADTGRYGIGSSFLQSAPSGFAPSQPRLTKSEYLLASGLYDANYHSPLYAALFVGISRFLLSDLTFNINGIMNISQVCGIVTGSIGYTTLGNLTIGAMIIGYLGKEGTEYTFPGQSIGFRLTADVRF
ncbi:MAG TPA: hypothetical protein VLX68_09310 [Chitinivibrionales bacterium]|nr:hypothetical protein [Chitinivibrionales bacterium]